VFALRFEWRKRARYLGTVRNGEPVVNLRGIVEDIRGDCYWDYDMRDLHMDNVDDYLAWRLCVEISAVVIHELTHIFTGLSNSHPTHDNWTPFIHKLLGFPPGQ
jgi:hypothetical protein